MSEQPPQRRMMVRAAMAVTALLVVGIGIYLVLDAFTVGSVTFRYVDEVVPKATEMVGKRLKVAGAFVGGSRVPAGPGRSSFALERGGFKLTVLAEDTMLPGGFDTPGRDVVVDGSLDAQGVLKATVVTTGCPSKYEGRKR
jgi:cytochrome c-type biogenesis protein CcmE